MGKFSDIVPITSPDKCKLCPLGRKGMSSSLDSADSGANACTQCGVGKYTEEKGGTPGSCIYCPIGRYNDQVRKYF